MKTCYINTASYWGVDFQNEYVQQASDTLVILFPGRSYTINAPYMYYSCQAAKECGYDILSLEYGFQKANVDPLPSETLELINETTDTIQEVLSRRNYENIICIGKSLGAFLQTAMLEDFMKYHTKYVYLTPTKRSIDGIKKTKGLVILGNADKSISQEDIREIAGIEQIKLKIIDGVGHGLDSSSVAESLQILKDVMQEIFEFIS
jgi:hypothetical protein